MLAQLVVDTLALDTGEVRYLAPHGPLLGGAPGLTMLDVLEVAGHVEEQFDVSFNDGVNSKHALTSIASLASFIRRQAPVGIAANLPALDVEFDETELMQPGGFRG